MTMMAIKDTYNVLSRPVYRSYIALAFSEWQAVMRTFECRAAVGPLPICDKKLSSSSLCARANGRSNIQNR